MLPQTELDRDSWIQSINGPFSFWGNTVTSVEYDYFIPKFSITFKCAGRPWTVEFKGFTWLTFEEGVLARAFTSLDKELLIGNYVRDIVVNNVSVFDSISLVLGNPKNAAVPITLIARHCQEATVYTSPEPPREMLL